MWWVLLVALLFSIQFWHSYIHRGISGGPIDPKSTLIRICLEPFWLVPIIAGVIWVLSARTALSAFDNLFRDTAVVPDINRQVAIRFRLALSQALVPGMLYWLYIAFTGHRAFYVITELLHMKSSALLELITSSGWALLTVWALIWVAALVALLPRKTLIWWLGAGAVFANGHVLLHFKIAFYSLTGIGSADLASLDKYLAKTAGLIGLAIFAAGIWLIAHRRKGGYTLTVSMLILSLLLNLDIDFSLANLVAGAWNETVSTVMSAVLRLGGFWVPVWANASSLAESYYCEAWFCYVYIETEIPGWLVWLPIPAQLAILYLHYRSLRWLITRGPSNS
ncbi:hypothetical protein JW859_01620 [bacterium]|nr:hypothetical protein [bacterium]